MDFVTLMTLKLTATKIGTDQFGNRYYEERRSRAGKPARRYVRYNGIAEASKVPADWHGWLHHTESTPPPAGGYNKHVWQLEHQPNVTGTSHAYRPDGHMLKGGKRKPATGDYEPWNPV
jgi:NADH:ubiquinone oxidoreductase subunit